jgi:cytochrome P450
MSDTVRTVLRQLLKQPAAKEREQWDVVKDLAEPLPLRVLMRVLGFPEEDHEKLRHWMDHTQELFGGKARQEQRSLLPLFKQCQQSLQEYSAYAEQLVCSWEESLLSKQKSSAECSVGHQMVEAVQNGRLRREQVAPLLFFLISAGHDTTTCLISQAVLALLSRPQQLECLRSQWAASSSQPRRDECTDSCIMEVLRHCAPIARMTRRVLVRPPNQQQKNTKHAAAGAAGAAAV